MRASRKQPKKHPMPTSKTASEDDAAAVMKAEAPGGDCWRNAEKAEEEEEKGDSER
jgi:hypothetical protein